MPPLSRRNAGRLLSTVGGKPHASSDDHEDDGVRPTNIETIAALKDPRFPTHMHEALEVSRSVGASTKRKAQEIVEIEDSPSPQKKVRNKGKTEAEASIPSPQSLSSGTGRANSKREPGKQKQGRQTEGRSMQDPNAEPVSSDDSEQRAAQSKAKAKDGRKNGGPAFKELKDSPVKPLKKQTKFKTLKLPVSDDELDDDAEIFVQSKQPKKPRKLVNVRKSSSSNTANIHAAPKSSQPKQAQYGKKASQKREWDDQAKEEADKKAKLASDKKKARERPKFKTFEGIDIPGSSQLSTGFDSSYAAGEGMAEDANSPLSDIPDEIDIGLGDSAGDSSFILCSFCGETIKKSLREDFEIEILKDRRLEYKWQRRLCAYHKQRTAHDLWESRGYPQVDYSKLPQRMRKHNAYLRRILNDEASSGHREAFKERTKQGRKREKEAVEEGSSKTIMGYYGPKGEKIMLDWIIGQYSDDLRDRATHDALISTKGMSGGVTGFVQVVLAPHLAELLIKEDMNLEGEQWEEQARAIIADSAELGELLHPEAEDRIGEDAYQKNTFGKDAFEDEEAEEEYAGRKEPVIVDLGDD